MPRETTNIRLKRDLFLALSELATLQYLSTQNYIERVLTAHLGQLDVASISLRSLNRGELVLALRQLADSLATNCDQLEPGGTVHSESGLT